MYVMIYLFALSELKGTVNLVFDSIFMIINLVAFTEITKLIIKKEHTQQDIRQVSSETAVSDEPSM